MVFPGHDYKGDTVSTIGEERAFTPRLQVKSVDEYVALMNGLNLSNPKMMDVAVPANIHQGLTQKRIAEQGWAVTAQDAIGIIAHPDVVLIDLQEKTNAPGMAKFPARCICPIPTYRKTPPSVVCCRFWQRRRTKLCCSIVLSANALPWRYRRRRMSG